MADKLPVMMLKDMLKKPQWRRQGSRKRVQEKHLPLENRDRTGEEIGNNRPY